MSEQAYITLVVVLGFIACWKLIWIAVCKLFWSAVWIACWVERRLATWRMIRMAKAMLREQGLDKAGWTVQVADREEFLKALDQIPTTPEEVERAEREYANNMEELPEELRDPYTVWERMMKREKEKSRINHCCSLGLVYQPHDKRKKLKRKK